MSARKAERLMNLFIVLLVSSAYVSKADIRRYIDDYREAPSDDAFERMFDRDKDELRAIGIPIEVGSFDKYFDDEPGYRVRRDAYELPDITLTADEVAVLGLAARVWEHAGLANSTADAVLKLQSAGNPVDTAALDSIHLRLPTVEPAFDPMLRATQERIPVRFSYRRPGAPEGTERHLQPWAVITSRGRWYVIGHDLDRDQPRMFRLSRVTGDVVEDGTRGTYEVPAGTDIRALSRQLNPAPSEELRVELLARQGAAAGLRRWATPSDGAARAGWDRLELTGRSRYELISVLLGYGDAIEVLGPPEIRDDIAQRATALLAALGGS